MTSGDAFPKGIKAVRHVEALTPETYRWYGSLREREAIRAMKQLGVPRSRIRLLGFPDEGLCQLADDPNADAVFASPYTRRDSPPPREQLFAEARYRGTDARKELEGILVAFRPNLIVVPDARDEHPDHCATHLLVHGAIEAAVRRGIRPPTVWHYVIHYRAWPADRSQFPPQVAFRTLRLSEKERATKRDAVRAYRTQMTVMSDFLTGFDAPEERFVIGDAEPAACWCGGRNIVSPTASSR